MNNKILRNGFFGLLGLLFSSALLAHGGAAGTDTDQCKFELEPDHWIHYTAYQPTSYPGDEFCGNLPNINTTTLLVFDYQDIRYRNMSVEFEVTKEPEGTRIFFQKQRKHKSGTVKLDLARGVSEVGKYLIHITLLQDDGKRLDVHMAFKAGSGKGISTSTLLVYLLIALAILYVFYLSNAEFRNKVDNLIKNSTKLSDD